MQLQVFAIFHCVYFHSVFIMHSCWDDILVPILSMQVIVFLFVMTWCFNQVFRCLNKCLFDPTVSQMKLKQSENTKNTKTLLLF